MSSSAALFFHPEAYQTDRARLMGRHAAGAGLLRAAVLAHADETLYAAGPDPQHKPVFEQLARAIRPLARTGWIDLRQRTQLGAIGGLLLPGPGLADESWLRLRIGPAAYSITGVTHTTASHAAMDAIAALVTGPVMPWDALICTSHAVRDTVEVILQAQADYLRWRMGAIQLPERPRLPVIPLGVHMADFVVTPDQRQHARAALGLTDEVVFLFVGRLSFHAKAHPEPLYRALQTASAEGRRIALIECGWFANDAIASGFSQAAKAACPDIRVIQADGRKADTRAACWAAADVFTSLSDNVQETFGLTPIEAMATGLPCLVSDWDGYRDTVRNGVDGFTIPTTMPVAPYGMIFSDAFAAQALTYDQYVAATAMTVSVDPESLLAAVCRLVDDPALRRAMGEAGRARARAVFDWAVVFQAYRALWDELADLRSSHPAARAAAPAAPPTRLDPYLTFRSYPSRTLGPATHIRRGEAIHRSALDLPGHAVFAPARLVDSDFSRVQADILAVLTACSESMTLEAIARLTGIHQARIICVAAGLLKTGVLTLAQD